jgi:GNAT superfamily N-acetyltransferase
MKMSGPTARMEALRIRDARGSDARTIEAVTLSAYQEYAPLMPSLWDAYRENIVTTLAAPEPASQLVAERGSRMVGTVLLYPAATDGDRGTPFPRPYPEVRLLAVAPASRGKGIGEALMRECIRRARRSGAMTLALHTTDLMRAAMRLYTRMGFQREPQLDFRPRPEVTIKGYVLDLRRDAATGEPSMSRKQSAAARRNVEKAARAARRKRTIARLPKKTRTALGKEGAKAARRKRKTR